MTTPVRSAGHFLPLQAGFYSAVSTVLGSAVLIPGAKPPARSEPCLERVVLLQWNPGTNNEKYSEYKAEDRPGTHLSVI